MNAIRKILMPFLVIPFGMFVYVFTHPDWPWEHPGLESLFAVVGIPILVGNFLAWFYPEIMRAYFPVKEDWGEKGGKPVVFAIVISTLIAFVCVGAGAASVATNARSTFNPSPLPPAAVTILARSNESQSRIANSSETDVVPLPAQSTQTGTPSEQALQSSVTGTAPETPETGILPEPTPQIPVSGATAVSSPSLAMTQTGITSTHASTGTAAPTGACVHADPNHVAAILQTIQDVYPDNEIGTGWAVRSTEAANLWFVAAKISGANVAPGTLPGVWALFVNSDGSFDIYSINDPAMQYSDAGLGAEADPVLTMQSNGAQAAYHCAAQAG